jgi:tyrosyl-tRNA synthetase
MDNSKARYYKIKNDRWNVINDIDPKKMAAETARRAELARQKEEKEAREREEAFQKLLIQEQQERERKLQEKRKTQEASQAAAAANAKAARDAAERARAAKAQADLVVDQQRKRDADAFVKSLNENRNKIGGWGTNNKCCVM